MKGVGGVHLACDAANAEAVADLIDSQTAAAARSAMRSLRGEFSDRVNALVGKITELRMYVEAAIDFPEEEIDFLADDELGERLAACSAAFDSLLSKAAVGRVMRDGYQVVIVGKPNAGKSSLMNRLSGEDTAIVTEIAGTTRDVLRERINIEGLAVELVDTAGLRDNPDRIEEEGIRRARAELARADHILWVFDDQADPGHLAFDRARLPTGVACTLVRNKIDRTGSPPGPRADSDGPELGVSAKTGAGIAGVWAEVARFRDAFGPNGAIADKRARQALAMAVDLGATALGFIFAASPRQITPPKVRDIIHAIPPFVKTVGVFVNEGPAEIKEMVHYCGLDLVQLHGDESPDLCHELMPSAIKALRIKNASNPWPPSDSPLR